VGNGFHVGGVPLWIPARLRTDANVVYLSMSAKRRHGSAVWQGQGIPGGPIARYSLRRWVLLGRVDAMVSCVTSAL